MKIEFLGEMEGEGAWRSRQKDKSKGCWGGRKNDEPAPSCNGIIRGTGWEGKKNERGGGVGGREGVLEAGS